MYEGIDAVGTQLGTIDLAPFTFLESAADLSRTVATRLQALLVELLDGLARLEAGCAETPGWQEAGDVCFVAIVQLRGVGRQLSEHVGYDDLLVGCESALRHVRRMLRALRDRVEVSSGGVRQAAPATLQQEIETALKVRALFNRFRRELRVSLADDRQAVLQALRYAAGALATAIGAADFRIVRASDRLLLLRLQRRVIGWARDGGSVEDGQRLLQDLATAAELLRGVNQRQELQTHDRALAARLLGAPPKSGADLPRYVAELAALDGHDAEIEQLITQVRGDLPDAAQSARLTAALERITGTQRQAEQAQAPLAK